MELVKDSKSRSLWSNRGMLEKTALLWEQFSPSSVCDI